MIIQLDSTFRCYKTYPYPTEFEINVNGKPPSSERLAFRDDLRSTNLTSQYVRYAYRWIGNRLADATPLSKLDYDTFQIGIVPIGPRTCVIIPNGQEQAILSSTSYFVGTIFWFGEDGHSANVIGYDNYQVLLDSNIFQEFYSDFCVRDNMDNPNEFENIMEDGYFINISGHQTNNLVLLGSSRFTSTILNRDMLPGLSVNLFVENVTQDWYSKIQSVDREGRNLILEEMPSYQPNDFFIVWKTPGFMKDESKKPPFLNGVRRFRIKNSDAGFKRNDWVQNATVLMRVKEVDKEGKILSLEILHPGQKQKIGELELQRYQRQKVVIEIIDLGSGIIMESEQNGNLLHRRYLLAVLDMLNNRVLYFTIDERRPIVIYLFIDPTNLQIINNNLTQYGIVYCYYISYETVFPNLCLPMIPTQNAVCARITLFSVSIPNLPVCGYNIRLSEFPYLLCSFGNAVESSMSNTNSIASNIPAVASSNFVLPIANVRNPFLNFVNLRCRQKALVKFTPKGTLAFKLSLPNGNPLRFNTEFRRPEASLPTMTESSFCRMVNVPLNTFYFKNSTLVYPYVLENGITVNFGIELLN